MEKELKDLIFASLFHDAGKLVERTEQTNFSVKDQNMYKYSHAAQTQYFLEKYFRNPDKTAVMASHHHNPSEFEEWCIAAADRHAAGHERYGKNSQEEFPEGKEKRPLKSVIAEVSVHSDEKDNLTNKYIMPGKISSENIFVKDYDEADFKSRYKNLFRDFCNEIQTFNDKVFHKEDFSEYNNAYRSIMSRYLWSVPDSARRDELPDVSLYEHSRITAMLAACLYIYHKKNNTDNKEALNNNSAEKYLMVGGDVSGIQKFIFDVPSKGAYKALKGRSFFIQLLPYLVARKILDAVNMDENQIIYMTGGHFYLMLPNIDSVRKAVDRIFDEVNLDLYKKLDGNLYVRKGIMAVSPQKLMNKQFSETWEEFSETLSFSDYIKFKDIVSENYKDVFKPDHEYTIENTFFIRFGENLRNGCHYILVKKDADGLLGYNVSLQETPDIQADHILCLDSGLIPDSLINYIYLPMGGLTGFTKEFDEVAEGPDPFKGSHFLGTLRMDVDNLGKIFREGFKNYRYKAEDDYDYYSISRVTTLSSQLIMYFTLEVDSILKQYENQAVVVYSGGDDLFIIGYWGIIPELAFKIRESFRRFTDYNSSFTVSAGISLTPGKYPLRRAADLAGEAEEAAKKYERKSKNETQNKVKDAVCFMNGCFDWKELQDIKVRFIDKITSASESDVRPLVTRINKVAECYKILKKQKEIRNKSEEKDILKLIEAEKWQWLMVYSFSRMKNKTGENNMSELAEDVQKYFTERQENNELGIYRSGIIGNWSANLIRKMKGGKNAQ